MLYVCKNLKRAKPGQAGRDMGDLKGKGKRLILNALSCLPPPSYCNIKRERERNTGEEEYSIC